MEPVDLSFIDEINAAFGVIAVIASYIFGDHWILFIAFIGLNILDYITGIIKAKILKTENSAAGFKGIVKKFSYWCMLIVAFMMAPVLNELGTVIGADISAFTPAIGYMVLAMMIMNEFRSVLENLYQSGVNIPVVVLKGLAIFEKAANDIQEKMFDGNLEIHTELASKDRYHVDLSTSEKELEERDSVTLKICTVEEEEKINEST